VLAIGAGNVDVTMREEVVVWRSHAAHLGSPHVRIPAGICGWLRKGLARQVYRDSAAVCQPFPHPRRACKGTRRRFVDQEATLSEWLERNATVCWIETPQPWAVETELLGSVNLDPNRQHV
jgi:hypothetical protein